MKHWMLSTLTGVAFTLSAASAIAQEYTMKFAITDAEIEGDHFSHSALRAFRDTLEVESDGRIDVNIFWNGQLGKIENIMNQIASGLVEGQVGADGQVAPFFPDVQVLGIPYLFKTREVAYEVLDGTFGQELADEMAAQSGIRPIAWLENGGFRNFSANVPLTQLEDLEGLKIRTMTNPIHMEIVRSLGASPTPIPWTDLYTSLQTGVVDGQENSFSTFRVPKLEEVQSNIINDGHVYAILTFYVSEKWYQSLPDDLQAAVRAAGEEAQRVNREISRRNEIADREYLEQAGVNIVDISVNEKARFQERTQQPAIDFLVESGVRAELIDQLLEAVEEAEAKLGL